MASGPCVSAATLQLGFQAEGLGLNDSHFHLQQAFSWAVPSDDRSLARSAALLVEPEPQGQFPVLRRGPSVLPNSLCSSTLEGVDRLGEESMKIGTSTWSGRLRNPWSRLCQGGSPEHWET